MGKVKEPIVFSRSFVISDPPHVRLLILYLEKREIMEDEERKEILQLIKDFCLPKHLSIKGAVPMEEDFLAKNSSLNHLEDKPGKRSKGNVK